MDPTFSPSRRRTRSSRMSLIQNEQSLKNTEEVLLSSLDISPCKSTSLKDDGSNNNNICTPKAKKFQIPKIKNCPPAPKKKRRLLLSSSCNDNSLKRSPISFFTTNQLDLEIFFNFGY